MERQPGVNFGFLIAVIAQRLSPKPTKRGKAFPLLDFPTLFQHALPLAGYVSAPLAIAAKTCRCAVPSFRSSSLLVSKHSFSKLSESGWLLFQFKSSLHKSFELHNDWPLSKIHLLQAHGT
ncbi:hypothetical protein BV494_22700 (plasmid) [Rahnella sikkimica]|uniref:Uncharacterized protein n=1 Tax=Rahnella sikkimica TaxID=1805933 RepID=A0A2L1UY08_9GAMM|nr:hypothetical protein BV494_22700 [Rahnella sikkimica]